MTVHITSSAWGQLILKQADFWFKDAPAAKQTYTIVKIYSDKSVDTGLSTVTLYIDCRQSIVTRV